MRGSPRGVESLETTSTMTTLCKVKRNGESTPRGVPLEKHRKNKMSRGEARRGITRACLKAVAHFDEAQCGESQKLIIINCCCASVYCTRLHKNQSFINFSHRILTLRQNARQHLFSSTLVLKIRFIHTRMDTLYSS